MRSLKITLKRNRMEVSLISVSTEIFVASDDWNLNLRSRQVVHSVGLEIHMQVPGDMGKGWGRGGRRSLAGSC